LSDYSASRLIRPVIILKRVQKNDPQVWGEENMMQKTDHRYRPAATVLLATILGVLTVTAFAGEPPGTEGSSFALIVMHPPGSANTDLSDRERFDCRRYGVIWSGGTALRRPDRISPRPVRSRWQAAGASRIRCADGGAFGQTLVADQPWIR
jgi:hypothetical protein